MTRLIIQLVLIAILVAFAAYLVTLNAEAVTLHLSSTHVVTANLGLVLLGAFALGMFLTSLGALFFAFKGYLRERQLIGREKTHRTAWQAILDARAAAAAHEWDRARALWEQTLRREPDNVVARVELSRALERSGDLSGALKVVETARASDPKNAEILFRGAELAAALDNKTAALDNLALAAQQLPSAHVYRMARDLAEKLGRYDDALRYHQELVKFRIREDEYRDGLARLELQKLLQSHEGRDLEEPLRAFVRRYPDQEEALHHLARLEASAGKTEHAAQLLARAAKSGRQPHFWRQATELWIKAGAPDRAVAAARTALENASGTERLEIESDVAELYLTLNMMEDARAILERALREPPSRTGTSDGSAPTLVEHRLLALYALYMLRTGRSNKASELLKLMGQEARESRIPLALGENRSIAPVTDGPSPMLSTP